MLTVRQLRKALENVPDELPVHFVSDAMEDTENLIPEHTKRITYEDSYGTVDYFRIYGLPNDEEGES